MMQDEYFQVDNSEIKHDGFFVNRGKLERMLVSQILWFHSFITFFGVIPLLFWFIFIWS